MNSNSQPSEFLQFLYDLRDILDTENAGPISVIEDARELAYEWIQKQEMKEWNL